MSVNKVILIGNVGQDPKVTFYDGGNCVAQLSFATSEKDILYRMVLKYQIVQNGIIWSFEIGWQK